MLNLRTIIVYGNSNVGEAKTKLSFTFNKTVPLQKLAIQSIIFFYNLFKPQEVLNETFFTNCSICFIKDALQHKEKNIYFSIYSLQTNSAKEISTTRKYLNQITTLQL